MTLEHEIVPDNGNSMPDSMQFPPLMTEPETISYLRLDIDDRKPGDRLRNLIRRQGLPVIRRGRLRLFRKTAVDSWLDASRVVTMDGGRRGLRRNDTPKRGQA